MSRYGKTVAALVAFEGVGLEVLHAVSASAVTRMEVFDPAGLLRLFAALKALAITGELLFATLGLGFLARRFVLVVGHDGQSVRDAITGSNRS